MGIILFITGIVLLTNDQNNLASGIICIIAGITYPSS